MISFSIRHIGSFMSKLLSTDCFDSFLLEEAVIKMAVTYTIDGRLNKEFYRSDVWDDPAQRPFRMQPWSEARLICREMIKGKNAPVSFRFTLHLKPESTQKVLAGDASLLPSAKDAVSALVINIRLDDTGLHLVTGTAMHTFVADKGADRLWDKTMERFLAARGIDATPEQ